MSGPIQGLGGPIRTKGMGLSFPNVTVNLPMPRYRLSFTFRTSSVMVLVKKVLSNSQLPWFSPLLSFQNISRFSNRL